MRRYGEQCRRATAGAQAFPATPKLSTGAASSPINESEPATPNGVPGAGKTSSEKE
jgi:hypothetical protein